MPVFLSIIIAALLTGGVFAQAESLPNASELHEPDGYEKVFEFHTMPASVQIYTCMASLTNTFTWAGGPDPDAILMSGDKSLTVHHYKGPVWEATDGSRVQGSHAKHFQATREKSVDWLELTADSGTQQFQKVGFIHRIETQGGIAPDATSHTCDGTHSGEQVRVPYTATYEFYAPK